MKRALAVPGLWLAVAGGLVLLAAVSNCRKVQDVWGWSPDTAAMVEGRPITMTELNQVLGWGFYAQLNQNEGAPASDSEDVPLLVLEKMIEERLVLAEADRRNLNLDESDEIGVAWLDEGDSQSDLPEAQAEIIRQNLLRQILLHKVTTRIMDEERELSAADWRVFWRDWPRHKPTRYLVRVLFLPPSQEAPILPERGRETLEQMAHRFKLEGFPAILSTAVWLQSGLLDSDLIEVLTAAWVDRKPSPPVRQESSWAIYEVLNLDRKTAAVDELKAARAAYELKAGEEAFRRWLSARRSEADIRINPSLIKPRE